MTSNLCEGGPFFAVKLGLVPGFLGGSEYSVTPAFTPCSLSLRDNHQKEGYILLFNHMHYMYIKLKSLQFLMLNCLGV